MTRTLSALGAAVAALAVLDPELGLPGWLGAGLAGAALLVARRRRAPMAGAGAVALAAGVWAVQAAVGFNLGADSRSYLAPLASAVFDHDLELADELRDWGQRDVADDAPLGRGLHPVGPSLLWSPLYLLAHVYVLVGRLLGRTTYTPDGLTGPYVRAAVLGTGALVAIGALFLYAHLRRRSAAPTAAVATSAAVLATPVAYYATIQPLMAHAIVFAVASALLWALGRVDEDPSGRRWILVGALLGLLVLCRWQGLVMLAMVGPLAVRDLVRRRAPAVTIAAAAAVAAVVFLPQLAVWKLQHGLWVTMPQGAGYVDWSSPHFLDVMLSADHGLFTWTPVALAGVAGLGASVRRWPLFAGGGLATVLLTAWVNGGVSDWAGSDAFGARRFDLCIPLLAQGLAPVLEAAARLASRRPLIAPTALVAALAAWNLGLLRLHTRGEFREAAPLEHLAARQAGQLHGAVKAVLGLAGPRGRHLAYDLFVGEYLYENVGLGGTIDVGREDARFLGDGWSGPRWREGAPRFRWALFPEACLILPLRVKGDLPSTLLARAPRRLAGQTFSVIVNGTEVGAGRLDERWTEAPFILPGRALVSGENRLCFRFARGTGEEGQQVGAQVARVQLP